MISQKKRFGIFHRDNFTCQYCGKSTPEVILEVDHVVSRKDGGGDEEFNLLTACFSCNRGKSAISVDIQLKGNKDFDSELQQVREKNDQIRAYYEHIKKKKELEAESLSIYQQIWQQAFSIVGSDKVNSLTEYGLQNIADLLAKGNPPDLIIEAINIAGERRKYDNNEPFKYMCGVLKNLRMRRENPEAAQEIEEAHKAYYALVNLAKTTHGPDYYFDKRLYFKWIKDGISMNYLQEAVMESRNWSALRRKVQFDCYE